MIQERFLTKTATVTDSHHTYQQEYNETTPNVENPVEKPSDNAKIPLVSDKSNPSSRKKKHHKREYNYSTKLL
jgi:hypothetical protein